MTEHGHHKGYVARVAWSKRNTLVRAGKASWWMPLRTIEEAVKAAGL